MPSDSAESRGGNLRRGVGWSTGAFLGARIVTFASTAVLARLLAPEEFGVVAAILVFIALIELTSDLGMKASVVYEQEEGFSRRLDVAFTLNLILAVALTVGGVLLAPVIAGFFHLGEHVDLFRVASLNPLFAALGNVHDAVMLRGLQFRRRALPEVGRAVVRAATQISLAAAGLGASALVIGLLAGTLAWALMLWSMTRYRPRPRMDRTAARELLRYGVPASALEFLAIISTRADVVIIGRLLGERVLGLYSLAFRVPELLIESVAWNVSRVAFPALARERVRDERGLSAMTAEILRWQALYALPVAAGLAVLSPALIVVLFGSAWREAAGVLSGIAFAAAIGSLALPIGDLLKATARQRALVLLNIVTLPVFVTAIVLVAEAGIVAVAWSRVGMRLLFGSAVVTIAARGVGIRPGQLARSLGPGLVTAFGLAAGAGAVRLAWPEETFVPLIAGGLAGAVGGAAALRLLAPKAFGDVQAIIRRRRAGKASVKG